MTMSIDLGKGVIYTPSRQRGGRKAGRVKRYRAWSPPAKPERPASAEARANSPKRNILLAAALSVAAFFWIWLFGMTGAKAYWVAPVALAVCLATGPTTRSLPYLVISAAGGVVLGFATFAVSMLVLPLYYGLSWAIAGALILLVAGLLSIPRMRDTLPMLLVGWGCFLGAIARFDYLFLEKPVEAMPRALGTFAGVLLSVMVGVLLAVAFNTLILAPRHGAPDRSPGRGPIETGTGQPRPGTVEK